MSVLLPIHKQLLLLLAFSMLWIIISLNLNDPYDQTKNKRERFHGIPNSGEYSKKEPGPKKLCENVLHNMTSGKWVPLDNPEKDSSYYDEIYRGYWLERQITEKLWRDDGKCGHKNELPQIPYSKWPRVASWCNPQSKTPCCDNEADGHCVASNPSKCECASCVDTRKYRHAEMCQWKTDDEKCAWRNYSTAAEACDVIERSPFNSLHFVGDSLIRNMFYALMMILTGDRVGGTWTKDTDEQLKKYCRAEKAFLYKCRNEIRSMADVARPESLCGGRKPNFTVDALTFHGNNFLESMIEMTERLSGREGSIIFIHIGLHMNLRAEVIIEEYLRPILKTRQTFYESRAIDIQTQWPQIYFIPPLLSGLMKPLKFLSSQGKEGAAIFAEEMKDFCDHNGATFFDVRPFSKFVHSFDGTHYGLGVNIMKNQLMLNHFNELTRS